MKPIVQIFGDDERLITDQNLMARPRIVKIVVRVFARCLAPGIGQGFIFREVIQWESVKSD
jgi:hypothetical protein